MKINVFFIFFFVSISNLIVAEEIDSHYYTFAEINGSKYSFMFNTGSTVSAISDNIINENKLNPEEGVMGKAKLNKNTEVVVKSYVLPDFKLLLNKKISVSGLSAIGIPLMTKRSKVDGIIGLDLIKNNFIWELNNKENKVFVYDKSEKLNLTCSSYYDDGENIVVSANVNNVPYDFYLNTGNESSFINNNLATKIDLIDTKENAIFYNSLYRGKGELSVKKEFLIKNLSFNGNEINDLRVTTRDEPNTLGANFVRSFDRFIIDAYRKHICVSK